MKYLAWSCLLFFFIQSALAKNNVVNIYAWAEEIPQKVIQQFEKETGIKVNYSAFESPEVMLAKLRTNKHPGYDIVEPGSLLVARMQQQGMLLKLDPAKLPNFKNVDPFFLNLQYDPHSDYSVPFIGALLGFLLTQITILFPKCKVGGIYSIKNIPINYCS